MSKHAFTTEQFIRAVASNFTIAAICRELGLQPVGGNYKTVHSLVLQLGLDTSHWLGRSHYRGQKRPTSNRVNLMNLEKVLMENGPSIKTTRLKELLLQVGHFTYKCVLCGISEWQERPLVLHIDHVNGKNRDNRLENLRLLCPNCHSQTATYTGRNKKSKVSETPAARKDRLKLRRMMPCPYCAGEKVLSAQQCRACHDKRAERMKIVWPPIAELKSELENSSYVALSRRLGVSDNAVRKHLKTRS